ncbi:MAG: LysE family transporter [Bacillota bacterium]|jgi:cysteine/O-acetylserine efflux protein|nr:LysE family transporter [Bacillota bacterium]
MPDVLAFASYVSVMTLTPGPNNMLCLVNGSRFGFRASMRFLAGLFTGVFIVMLGCSYFAMSLEGLVPSFRPIAEALGGLYMLHLAVKVLDLRSGDADAAAAASASAPPQAGPTSFAAGLGMQFINVKMLLYGITVTSSFVVPYYKSPLALAAMSLLLAACSVAAGSCWVAFGAAMQRLFGRHGKVLSWVMFALLLYSAASISGVLQKVTTLLN